MQTRVKDNFLSLLIENSVSQCDLMFYVLDNIKAVKSSDKHTHIHTHTHTLTHTHSRLSQSGVAVKGPSRFGPLKTSGPWTRVRVRPCCPHYRAWKSYTARPPPHHTPGGTLNPDPQNRPGSRRGGLPSWPLSRECVCVGGGEAGGGEGGRGPQTANSALSTGVSSHKQRPSLCVLRGRAWGAEGGGVVLLTRPELKRTAIA